MRKLIVLLFSIGFPAGVFYFLLWSWAETNDICDTRCRNEGYAAGELLPGHQHTICACFNRTPTMPTYILHRRSTSAWDSIPGIRARKARMPEER